MTEEEAVNERLRTYTIWAEMPKRHPGRNAAYEAWRESVRQFNFLFASPTQQLCIVAKMLREDTNE